jgi:Ca2+-binding EF-hand superfamily protein
MRGFMYKFVFELTLRGNKQLCSSDEGNRMDIAFDGYDIDGNGTIDFNEMVHMQQTTRNIDIANARTYAEIAFEAIGFENEECKVTRADFKEICSKGLVVLDQWPTTLVSCKMPT